jgi:Domain of unknown function (DUF5666)
MTNSSFLHPARGPKAARARNQLLLSAQGSFEAPRERAKGGAVGSPSLPEITGRRGFRMRSAVMTIKRACVTAIFLVPLVIAASLPLWTLLFSTAELKGGEPATFADIKVGQAIAVEGRAFGNSAILANEIEIQDLPEGEQVEGRIEAIDSGAISLTVLGVKIFAGDAVIQEVVKLEDDGDQQDADEEDEEENNHQVTPLVFEDLLVGDWVEVKGSLQGSSEVHADLIELTEADENSEIEGIVEAVDQQMLTVLGATIRVDPGTQIEYD